LTIALAGAICESPGRMTDFCKVTLRRRPRAAAPNGGFVIALRIEEKPCNARQGAHGGVR
jgi:hypothetical protein